MAKPETPDIAGFKRETKIDTLKLKTIESDVRDLLLRNPDKVALKVHGGENSKYLSATTVISQNGDNYRMKVSVFKKPDSQTKEIYISNEKQEYVNGGRSYKLEIESGNQLISQLEKKRAILEEVRKTSKLPSEWLDCIGETINIGIYGKNPDAIARYLDNCIETSMTQSEVMRLLREAQLVLPYMTASEGSMTLQEALALDKILKTRNQTSVASELIDLL